MLSRAHCTTISSSSIFYRVTWLLCICNCSSSLNFNHGTFLHLNESNSRKLPQLRSDIADIYNLDFLSLLGAKFCCVVNIKHRIMILKILKYFLLSVTFSLCSLFLILCNLLILPYWVDVFYFYYISQVFLFFFFNPNTYNL